MPALLTPSFAQVAAALFPLPGCTIGGYSFSHGARFTIVVSTPAGLACPREYRATGACRWEALAAVVSLFNDSAHAYPSARPHAGDPSGAGSYAPR
ncbi:hypothetical protein [Hymenobacter ruber]